MEVWRSGGPRTTFTSIVPRAVDLPVELGAIATWEAAEISEKSTTYGTNILLELENGGDSVALHANGVGYVPNDANYSVEKMTTELRRQRGVIDALGVHVRDVSNICSVVDGVKTAYVDTGKAKWRKASEIVDLFKAAS